MARKYDWGDGRKVHSRAPTKKERARNKAKTKRSGGGGGGGKSNQDDPFKIAMDLASKVYAPAIHAAKQDILGAQEHLKPGGALDQAYNQSGQSIADSQAAAGQIAQQTQGQANQVTNFTTNAAAQLGAEQAAYAQQQQNLYGQTAKAAQVATQNAGANVVQLGQAGQNLSGFLGALGTVQAGLGVSQRAGNEARRGEARIEGGRALQARKDKLTEVRNKRGETASQTAVDMAKDIRDFELAQSTLDQRDKDSLRDYRATLKGIAAQGVRQDDQQEAAADLQDDQQGFTAGENKKQRAATLKAARIKARAGADGKKGTADDLTPSQAASNVTARTKLDANLNTVLGKLTDGKSTSKEEVRKRAGLKPGKQFDAVWDMVTRKNSKGRYSIPRKHLPYLRSLFYGGVLPKDLQKIVDKK